MTDLLAARLQMAFSLGFHIIFACIGMVMPFLMAMAHWYWLKTRNKVYLSLTKSWMIPKFDENSVKDFRSGF